MKKIEHSFQFGDRKVVLETGRIANQASGAVLVSMGDTVVLVTAVVEKDASEPRDFFPLTVNYQERYYANGRFPGGYVKREGRPSVQETLIARLIDRPIRPLFPKGFTNEIQIVATVLSMDSEIPADIPAMLGAAAALGLSGAPFNGPLAGARVGYRDGDYVLNPTKSQLQDSALDLVVAGTADAVLMVESKAQELPEDIMLGAVMFGHQQLQAAVKGISDFVAAVGVKKMDYKVSEPSESLLERIRTDWGSRLEQAFAIGDKQEREGALVQVRTEAIAAMHDTELEEAQLEDHIFTVEREIVRRRVLEDLPRIDGRNRETVRPISIELDLLPCAHGSALFTRGETQALVVATLGVNSDAQSVDTVAGGYSERFMLHYNFPPYCTGELGVIGSPKRRELGHGNLARRALEAVMPSEEEFPYVVRLVSEITSSNGSSSMASVCGGCMALMAAGVPIKAPVAGVAMGLVKEGDDYAILTDILGDEDHLGDMDFKVAGTASGVTALQMDIKTNGITEEIMRQALAQAHRGRMHILGIMQQTLVTPRVQLSAKAPRLLSFNINPDKIKDVIGKGGSVIRSIIETSGATVDIKDDGAVVVASPNEASAYDAKRQIELLVADPEVGMVYHGMVSRILDFGALVTILPGKDGLLHISQISNERVKNVRDYLTEGQQIDVKVIEVDAAGKIKLSRKALIADKHGEAVDAAATAD